MNFSLKVDSTYSVKTLNLTMRFVTSWTKFPAEQAILHVLWDQNILAFDQSFLHDVDLKLCKGN